jgi:very-short-patch-repair endonuclease
MAAVLACGPRALLSHASAAHLWGVRPPGPDQIVDVTVVGRQVRQRPGIRVHRVAELSRQDIRRRNGIPVTSPARTLVDVSSTLDERELEIAVHEALVSNLLTLGQLRAALDRYPRRRGCARLVEFARANPTSVTRSGGEEELHRLLRKSGLPQPHTNARIGSWTVDFYWPQFHLVVEVDGSDFHRTRWSVERDRRKDLDLRGRQLDVVRFAGRQVRRQPELVLVTIARAIG